MTRVNIPSDLFLPSGASVKVDPDSVISHSEGSCLYCPGALSVYSVQGGTIAVHEGALCEAMFENVCRPEIVGPTTHCDEFGNVYPGYPPEDPVLVLNDGPLRCDMVGADDECSCGHPARSHGVTNSIPAAVLLGEGVPDLYCHDCECKRLDVGSDS